MARPRVKKNDWSGGNGHKWKASCPLETTFVRIWICHIRKPAFVPYFPDKSSRQKIEMDREKAV
jgi:hypothetical protein